MTLALRTLFAALPACFVLPAFAATPAASRPSTTAPTTTSSRSPDAANLYRRAFAKLDELGEADRGRLGLCGVDGCWVLTTPLDASSDHLLAGQKEAIDLGRRAASLPITRWDLNGDSQKVVDLANRAPRLSALLTLNARQELRGGNPKQAADDILAAIALSRQVAAETTLMTKLVETLAWRPPGELLAQSLPTMPKEIIAGLPAAFDRLPPSPTMEQLVRGEHAYAKASAARQNLTSTLMVGGLGSFYDAIAEGASSPQTDFDKIIDEQMAKHSLNPWAKIIGPQFKRSRETVAVFQARQAMLDAAIAIVLKGEQAVGASKDPFGKGPFGYHARPGGFELTSELRHDGVAVKLTVGPTDSPSK